MDFRPFPPKSHPRGFLVRCEAHYQNPTGVPSLEDFQSNRNRRSTQLNIRCRNRCDRALVEVVESVGEHANRRITDDRKGCIVSHSLPPYLVHVLCCNPTAQRHLRERCFFPTCVGTYKMRDKRIWLHRFTDHCFLALRYSINILRDGRRDELPADRIPFLSQPTNKRSEMGFTHG